MQRGQFINMATSDRQELLLHTLNATPTGSTNAVVLRFDTAVDVAGDALVVTTTAAAGTSVKVSAPGIYAVSLVLAVGASGTILAGLSVDVAAAGLTGDPAYANAGTLLISGDVIMPAATQSTCSLSTVMVITQAMAAGAATGTIRGLCSNSGGAAPTVLVAAECSLRIVKIAECNF